MISKELPSGAILEGTPLAYGEAWAVSQALLKEIERLKIDLAKIDLQALGSGKAEDIPLEAMLAFKDPLCALLGSQKVVEAVDKCLKKFTYNSVRISADTFEKREARKDYLFAAFYVLWENIAPFFEGLPSAFKTS